MEEKKYINLDNLSLYDSLMKEHIKNQVDEINGDLNSLSTNYAETIIGLSNVQTQLNNKIDKSGGTVTGQLDVNDVLRNGNTFYNVLQVARTDTPTEIVIKTKIPYYSSNSMPVIHLKGYAYGESSTIEMSVAFYIYNNNYINYSVISTCPWKPTVYLSSYVENSISYVALSFAGSIYYPRFVIDYIDIWDKSENRDYSYGWSVEIKSDRENTSNSTIIPATNKVTVPYKPIANDITGNAATATNAEKLGGVPASSYAKKTDIPASLKNPKALTFGSKTYDGSEAKEITAADLGLSGAMRFLGTSTTAISDGSTTKTITVNGNSVTVIEGNVALYNGKEFVWDGSKWEELGHEGSFKVKQTAVASPSASGTSIAFIDTIAQDANGNITATKKNVQFPVTSVAGKTGAVTLNKGDLGLGNVDNTADANKSVKHATTADNVTWSSTPTAGSVTPIGASLSSEHSANRLAYLNPKALSFEYSDDGGASWAPYNLPDESKLSLVTTNGGFAIGNAIPATTNHRTRVTLTAQDGTTGYFYTQTRKLLLNVSSSGHGMSVTIEIKTGESGANWRTLGTYYLAGWSGWNDIPLGAFSFGGSTSQTKNIWYMRLTFATTSIHEPYKNSRSTVIGMRLFGDTCWTRTSNMGETGHLYSYDIYQNAAFPGSVQATDVFDKNGNFLRNKVDKVVNTINSNGIPVMLNNSSSIAAYKGYSSEAIPDTLIYRTEGTGAFNVVDATSSRHPVPKAQMESYAVKKNTDKQTVYITDPNGNQSSKKYTSEGYPSTIVHREAALNTFIVADPVYNGHPVTMRFGNERYFPIQKSSTKRVYKKFTISNASNFSTELNNWLNTNTEMGQKLFTDPSVSFSGTTVVTIIADPTDSITSAKKIINPACYSGENAYACSAGLLIKAANNSNLGYVFKGTDGVWKFSKNNTPESFNSMVAANSSVISNGSYIDFYDVADYTEHVTSAVMIQDPSGNPSYKNYSSGPSKLGDNVAGNIVAFNSSGYFNVPDPVGSLHPVNKAWVEKNAATKSYVDSEVTKLLQILEGQLLTKIVCKDISVFTNVCVLKNNDMVLSSSKWVLNKETNKYETYVPRGSKFSVVWATVGAIKLTYSSGGSWTCGNDSANSSTTLPLQASVVELVRTL